MQQADRDVDRGARGEGRATSEIAWCPTERPSSGRAGPRPHSRTPASAAAASATLTVEKMKPAQLEAVQLPAQDRALGDDEVVVAIAVAATIPATPKGL